MKELFLKHYGKLVAFLGGWAAEAMVDLSAWLVAAKTLVGF